MRRVRWSRAANMRVKVQQVVGHPSKTEGDPGAVYSLDFNPATGQLATCGPDKEIKARAAGARGFPPAWAGRCPCHAP